ncbi:hypothetical protein ABNG02_13330 [Halorubrum ejinorense]|uniref:Envelope protein N-terminal domain-containing protein n=1 Tax=Halorubrum ejinorense TaxID=425309 RepID=A0AAV3SXF0_9EURY
MTATQPDKERTLTRRGVLKTTAVGVGSVATIGGASKVGLSPVGSASAIAPLVAAGYAGAIGLGYLMYRNAEKETGQEQDYSNFTGSEALKRGIYEDALSTVSANERVLTSISNNVKNSENVALAKGKAAALTVMNNGGTESEAATASTEAVNSYYSTIQENLITHFDAQIDKIISAGQSVQSKIDANVDTIQLYLSGSYQSLKNVYEQGVESVNLLDGSTAELSKPGYAFDTGSGQTTSNNFSIAPPNPPTPTTTDGDGNTIQVEKWRFASPDGGSVDYGYKQLETIWSDIIASRDEVNANLTGLVSDIYAQYEQGDIPTEDILDPITAATELGQNTGLSSQAAAAGMMGIPTSAGFALRLELQDDSGETYEVDGEIYTNAQPNDSDGNPAGFAVGQTYDPSNFEAPIYVSYEYIDPDTGERSTDFTQIVNPFTVLEATDSEGNDVEEVTPTSRTAQTADISSIEEELASIREEQQRLLETTQPPSGGAGAGFFGGESLNVGAIAAVVGAVGVVYALATGGGS